MSTDPELPNLVVTRAEKLLAFALAVFLLVGGLWVYFQPLDRSRGFAGPGPPAATAAQRRAIDAGEGAREELRRAERRRDQRLRTYEQAREDYRTDLDAGAPAAASRRTFERARARLADARRQVGTDAAAVRRTAPAARQANREVQAAERRASALSDTLAHARRRDTALFRLAWVLLSIGAAFWLFNWLRRRRSNYFVVGVAAVGAATVQALVMAGDYLGDEIDLADSGPLVISLAGITASILALVGLERYLARRAPRRRVRHGQCPYCAYPLRGGGTHCEGCGRETLAACAACSAQRRVGTPHCAACGAA